MSTHKRIDVICVVAVCLALIITVLFMNGKVFGLTATADVDNEGYAKTEYFSANEQNSTWWQNRDTTDITLSDGGITIDGQGAYELDGSLYIKNGGYYLVSGELSDDSIYVDAYSSSKVYICLNGVNISNPNDAGIRVIQAGKVFLTVAQGTENSVIMNGDTLSEAAEEDGVNAAIFSRDDLVINGKGTLNIEGTYKHGINAKDDLILYDVTLNIKSLADAIKVNDTLTSCANISIDAGDDGIHSDESVVIVGGNLEITNCYEGIEAHTITVYDGDINIYPSDDGFNANGGSDSFGMGGMGGMNMQSPPDMSQDMPDFSQRPDFTENSDDSDTSGRPQRPDFSQMPDLEGNTDGTDTSERPQRPDFEQGSDMRQSFGDTDDASDVDSSITIYGGNITVVNNTGNDADGLDSNGDILIYGGNIRISLTDNGSNSAIDYGSENGGKCVIEGGTVVACGSSSMAEAFDSDSTQVAILYNFSDGADSGSTVALSNSSGETLISYEAPCSFNSVNISCPGLSVGETYTISIGDMTEELTIEEISQTYGDSSFGGFGGGFGNGGGRPGAFGNDTDSENSEADDTTTVTDGSENSQRMTPPDMNSEDFQRMTPPDQSSQGREDAGEETVRTGTPLSELDVSVWYYLGASVIVLLLALVFVKIYRKK